MPVGNVTDGEFIEIWRLCQGNSEEVARRVGTTRRNVMSRRRRLEGKHNLRLESTHQKAHHYKHLSPAVYSARQHVSIENGHAIVWSDAHFWPGVRTTAFRALLLFCRELKPKVNIDNGDSFDGASISRHPRIGWEGRPSVKEELNVCKERHEEIVDAYGDSKFFWDLGNHDSRFSTRLAANSPEYEGVPGFDLKEHFPKWTPAWSTWINNDIVVKHRYRNGVHATHMNTMWAGKTIVTGHLHSLKVTPLDDYNGTRWGVDTGTLADPRGPQFVDYLEDNPVNWRSGFVVLTFHKGQLLWPEVCRVVDHNTVDFRGCLIDVSAE